MWAVYWARERSVSVREIRVLGKNGQADTAIVSVRTFDLLGVQRGTDFEIED